MPGRGPRTAMLGLPFGGLWRAVDDVAIRQRHLAQARFELAAALCIDHGYDEPERGVTAQQDAGRFEKAGGKLPDFGAAAAGQNGKDARIRVKAQSRPRGQAVGPHGNVRGKGVPDAGDGYALLPVDLDLEWKQHEHV